MVAEAAPPDSKTMRKIKASQGNGYAEHGAGVDRVGASAIGLVLLREKDVPSDSARQLSFTLERIRDLELALPYECILLRRFN